MQIPKNDFEVSMNELLLKEQYWSLLGPLRDSNLICPFPFSSYNLLPCSAILGCLEFSTLRKWVIHVNSTELPNRDFKLLLFFSFSFQSLHVAVLWYIYMLLLLILIFFIFKLCKIFIDRMVSVSVN